MSAFEPLLEVRGLAAGFGRGRRHTPILDDVRFHVRAGETVGLVGESGSGKSLTALAIMGLLDKAQVEGEVRFEGRNLLGLAESELRALRGHRMSMIFQEPMTSLNPVFTIGEQLAEPLRRRADLSAAQRRTLVIDALRETGMANPEAVHDEYPHRLSGGMRQRAMIALAMVGSPSLLIADEPTTALDVTVQAQILSILKGVQRRHRMAMLLVTHDFGVIAETCDRVIVMYAGKVVETASVRDLFDHPRHPYTAALLASRPHLAARGESLRPIPGTVPRPGELPPGCVFVPRCPRVMEHCHSERPPLISAGDHTSRCWLNAPQPEKAIHHA